MTNLSKDEMTQLLAEKTCTVTFTKVDGTKRVLKGTTNLGLIPTQFHPKNQGRPSVVSPKIVTVFDLEANGWRSFQAQSVLEFDAA